MTAARACGLAGSRQAATFRVGGLPRTQVLAEILGVRLSEAPVGFTDSVGVAEAPVLALVSARRLVVALAPPPRQRRLVRSVGCHACIAWRLASAVVPAPSGHRPRRRGPGPPDDRSSAASSSRRGDRAVVGVRQLDERRGVVDEPPYSASARTRRGCARDSETRLPLIVTGPRWRSGTDAADDTPAVRPQSPPKPTVVVRVGVRRHPHRRSRGGRGADRGEEVALLLGGEVGPDGATGRVDGATDGGLDDVVERPAGDPVAPTGGVRGADDLCRAPRSGSPKTPPAFWASRRSPGSSSSGRRGGDRRRAVGPTSCSAARSATANVSANWPASG